MPNASFPGAAAPTVADVWNKLIADTFTAASIGQRLKDAVGLDTFGAARITDISKISSAAIAAGDTANSIAQKLRGATDNQAFPSTPGMRISSFDNADFSMTASQTTDIIPATGESDTGIVMVRTAIGSDTFRVSADSGTNYAISRDFMANDTNFLNEGATALVIGIGNSTGRYRIVTDGGVGIRNFVRVITTFV